MSSSSASPRLSQPLSGLRAATALLTVLRARETRQPAFVHAADRLARLLAEAALGLYATPVAVTTPCDERADGAAFPPPSSVAAVSIMRSGDVIAEAFRALEPAMSTGGRLLIQRDEHAAGKPPRFLLAKLPPALGGDGGAARVFLCDPMLASGGTAAMALRELLRAGVREERITLVCFIAAPEGVARVAREYPAVDVVVAALDERLNGAQFICPGLGDMGDRYFGTTDV